MKSGGAALVVFLIVLSLLGGGAAHAAARDCPDMATAMAMPHGHHTGPAAESRRIGPLQHLGPSAACNGLSCAMSGCCFPRIAVKEIGMPHTASLAMPLLLVIDGSGTDPAEVEHPPRIS